jgi:hypothetical protein
MAGSRCWAALAPVAVPPAEHPSPDALGESRHAREVIGGEHLGSRPLASGQPLLEEGEVEAGDAVERVGGGPEAMTVAELDGLLYLPR